MSRDVSQPADLDQQFGIKHLGLEPDVLLHPHRLADVEFDALLNDRRWCLGGAWHGSGLALRNRPGALVEERPDKLTALGACRHDGPIADLELARNAPKKAFDLLPGVVAGPAEPSFGLRRALGRRQVAASAAPGATGTGPTLAAGGTPTGCASLGRKGIAHRGRLHFGQEWARTARRGVSFARLQDTHQGVPATRRNGGLLRIALAQINATVGDIEENASRALAAIKRATELGASLTVLPEMTIPGYPAEDLLLRPDFAMATRRALDDLAREVTDGAALVGFVDWNRHCYNALAVVANGRVQAIYRKRFLPNYGVFDEARYFQPGSAPLTIEIEGLRVGLTICEDIWYATPVAAELASADLDLICCASASPFHLGKADWRERMLATRAADSHAALAFCNMVGGQDELVFDGRSAIFDATGDLIARARAFEEDLVFADLDLDFTTRYRLREPRARGMSTALAAPAISIEVSPRHELPTATEVGRIEVAEDLEAELWHGLRTGIRDYVGKNGFPKVFIGLSGGIDSALTATLAADALGSAAVVGVAMPSRFSSPESLADAQRLGENLAVAVEVIEIDDVVAAFERSLSPIFDDRARDVTEENLQARARGTILMALSNKLGGLVLATGNKSEMSVGYSTLYGDMVGGFAPLRDVDKTWVYRLSRWRNATTGQEVIPLATIERPPTAELRPAQLDSDSLPPYPVLDRILEGYVALDRDSAGIASDGLPRELVDTVIAMVDRAEYKRRQGPVGIKVTPRALGRDRRMPITNRYRND